MPTPEQTTIVVIGDSITKGGNIACEHRFTTLVQAELTKQLGRPIAVANAGVDADTSELARDRLDRDALAQRPDYVVIMFGVNDAGFFRPETPDAPADTPRVALDAFRANLADMACRVARHGAHPVLATPVPMSRHYWLAHLPFYVENGLNFLVKQYAEAVREVASGLHTPLIDVCRAFLECPGTGELIPDGVHPDERGHRLVADVYVRRLTRILSQ